MFNNATSFNQPLNNWNVSNVSDMDNMFNNATSFNQPLNNWNVSNVSDMDNMFDNAVSFNQYLSSWVTSNVSDMNNMFGNAHVFNNGQIFGDATHPLGWITQPQSGVSIPVSNFRTNTALTDGNAQNYQGIIIG